MAFVTKTWKDRLVEYAGRRKLKNVSTGEEVLMDVSRSEGTVNQAGDAFSATNMNDLEQRIKTEFDNVNSSLADGKIKFGIDADGNYGYIKDGADSVTPFKNGSNIIYIGSGGSTDYRTSTLTFNVSSILPNYKDLTADNFFVNITNLRVSAYNSSGDGDGSSKSASVSTVPSYNPSTGVLTVRVYVGVSSNKANGGAYIGSCKVYYIDNKLPVS